MRRRFGRVSGPRRGAAGSVDPRPVFGRTGRLLAAALLAVLPGVPGARAGDGIQSAGDGLRLILPAAAAGTTVLHRDLPGAVQFAESAVLTGLVTEALKRIVDEKRPNGNRYSFPSGHASISFCSAEFMRKRYGWKFGVPAYAASAFVAYSRVEARKHWVHDVAAGAALGWVLSSRLTRPAGDWRVGACAGGRFVGVRISRGP
jgi:hypothetical protein